MAARNYVSSLKSCDSSPDTLGLKEEEKLRRSMGILQAENEYLSKELRQAIAHHRREEALLKQ